MDLSIDRLSRRFQLFLIPTLLEGIAALWFITGSLFEPGGQALRPASTTALLLAGLLFGLVLVLAYLVWRERRTPGAAARGWLRANRWLEARNWSAAVVFLGAVAGIFIAATLLFHVSPLDTLVHRQLSVFPSQPLRWYEWFTGLYQRAWPLLAWLLLAGIHLIYSVWPWQKAHLAQAWRDGTLRNYALLLAITLLCAAHWCILILRLDFLLRVPGWKWYFQDKGSPSTVWLFTGLVVCMLIVITAIRRLRSGALQVAALMGLAVLLQVSFGYMEGQGIESLRQKYAGSVFNSYAQAAAAQPDFLTAMRDYEHLYGGDWYLGTKPPGVLAVYLLTENVANHILPAGTPEGRFYALTYLIALVFPALSFLLLPLLYAFTRDLAGADVAFYACVLYVTCANVLLIPLFLDQVIYPAVFVLNLILFWQAMRRRSIWLAGLAGISLYAAIFLSFSLLPLLPLVFLWLGSETLLGHDPGRWKTAVYLAAATIGGLLGAYLLARVALNYDPLLRYQNAMIHHRLAKDFQPGLGQVRRAIVLNNTELLTWTGIPVMLVAGLQMLRSIQATWQQRALPLDKLSLAFLVTYAGLNLLGQTDGEVQRLWLFLVPLICTLAAQSMHTLFKKPWSGILWMVSLQWITTYLIFRFQDFYG
ncbi:MAG: hypothetical protein VB089_05750 [Anaerolineaceae bacterium]|nr:hypothetical protein [Anaerolineaceae bacterium]